MNQSSAAHVPQVRLPGCKSLSQRALILAASGSGHCQLSGLSSCDDSRFLLEALRGLGVSIEPAAADAVSRADGVDGVSTADQQTEWIIDGLGAPPQS